MFKASKDRLKHPFIAVLGCLALLSGCEKTDPVATTPTSQEKSDTKTLQPPAVTPLFVDHAKETGLKFEHYGGATDEYFLIEPLGSGGALFDYDNDGDLDVYLIQGARVNTTSTLLLPFPSFPLENKLFENRLIPDGKLSFTDVTKQAQVGDSAYGMGVAVADFDNNGFQDLFVTKLGPGVLYLNQGDGSFSKGSIAVDAHDEVFGTSASVLDFNQDGYLDLYIAQYTYLDRNNSIECIGRSDSRDYCTPDLYNATPDLLFSGDGTGLLTLVKHWRSSNMTPQPGLGVVAADYNGDELTDLYVANDGKPNLLWLNQGNGKFSESAVMNGVALNGNGKEEASMGVTSADVDDDGDEDLFMTHLKGETNTLYTNLGDAIFIDSTISFRLSADSLPATGFGTRWFDMDNDGDLDLFVANGGVKKEPALLNDSVYPYAQHNQLFENQGDLKFADVSKSRGLQDLPMSISRGAIFGDIDNDGDVDVVVTNNHGPTELLINQTPSDSHWLTVRLQSGGANRDAIGARIAVESVDGTLQWRRVGTDGSYLSSNDLRTHFGLGSNPDIKSVHVDWPGGDKERFDVATVDQHLTLVKGQGNTIRK